MHIRRASITDLDVVRFLFYDTVTTVNAKDYSVQQIEVWRAGFNNIENWERKIEEQYFLLAEAEEGVAGFASLTNDGYLDFMYVHKDFHGKGIAKALLTALEKRGNELQLTEIITDSSITAKPFFEKNNFIISEITVKEIKGVEFVNTKMKKYL